VVLYGCDTLFLILREEHRLGVFENRVLRRICGPKRDEVTGRWRNLHNEEPHNLYYSQNTIRMIRSRKNACRILVGKPEVKRPLRRLKRMWLDVIKMDIREIG
jgi:hypothetical protein